MPRRFKKMAKVARSKPGRDERFTTRAAWLNRIAQKHRLDHQQIQAVRKLVLRYDVGKKWGKYDDPEELRRELRSVIEQHGMPAVETISKNGRFALKFLVHGGPNVLEVIQRYGKEGIATMLKLVRHEGPYRWKSAKTAVNMMLDGSTDLIRIVRKYPAPSDIRNIYELVSRSGRGGIEIIDALGREALELGERLHTFEPDILEKKPRPDMDLLSVTGVTGLRFGQRFGKQGSKALRALVNRLLNPNTPTAKEMPPDIRIDITDLTPRVGSRAEEDSKSIHTDLEIRQVRDKIGAGEIKVLPTLTPMLPSREKRAPIVPATDPAAAEKQFVTGLKKLMERALTDHRYYDLIEIAGLHGPDGLEVARMNPKRGPLVVKVGGRNAINLIHAKPEMFPILAEIFEAQIKARGGRLDPEFRHQKGIQRKRSRERLMEVGVMAVEALRRFGPEISFSLKKYSGIWSLHRHPKEASALMKEYRRRLLPRDREKDSKTIQRFQKEVISALDVACALDFTTNARLEGNGVALVSKYGRPVINAMERYQMNGERFWNAFAAIEKQGVSPKEALRILAKR